MSKHTLKPGTVFVMIDRHVTGFDLTTPLSAIRASGWQVTVQPLDEALRRAPLRARRHPRGTRRTRPHDHDRARASRPSRRRDAAAQTFRIPPRSTTSSARLRAGDELDDPPIPLSARTREAMLDH